jgi:hypothetical protein
MKKRKEKSPANNLGCVGIIMPDEKYYKKILIEDVFINPSLLRTTRYDRNSRSVRCSIRQTDIDLRRWAVELACGNTIEANAIVKYVKTGIPTTKLEKRTMLSPKEG